MRKAPETVPSGSANGFLFAKIKGTSMRAEVSESEPIFGVPSDTSGSFGSGTIPSFSNGSAAISMGVSTPMWPSAR